MKELKGDWKDLFNGFMIALDFRKMFLGLCGIVFSMILLAGPTWMIAQSIQPTALYGPKNLAPHEFWQALMSAFHVIFTYAPMLKYVLFGVAFTLGFIAIWSFFGGAICRIAAYEIARDGERIEISKAIQFSGKKFSAFFWAPLLCVLGFLFFYVVTSLGGVVGGLLDYLRVGAPLIALLLPLAFLAGFIMVLVLVGTAISSFLFMPAVAAEGTDSFDAVSRGFSYVYAKPWHTLWYQGVSAVYGYLGILFVIYFASTMCLLGLKAGNCGYQLVAAKSSDGKASKTFERVEKTAWSMILSQDHLEHPKKHGLKECVKHPYGRYMATMNRWTGLDKSFPAPIVSRSQQLAVGFTAFWLLITLGMAFSYLISFFFSSQTMIYFLLRKKMDGIEMNEVFEDSDEMAAVAPPVPQEKESKPAGDKK